MESHRNISSWMLSDENDTELVGYVPYSERPETYIVPVVFAIIFLVGVLGNSTLVFIFARHRTMRNVPNTYIFSLALGDLLVILSCVPFTSTLYTIESWPWGELICKFFEATKDVSIGVSVFTLTALSADRYCAIVNPFRSHISSKPLTITTAILIWIMSLILAIPTAIYSNVQSLNLQDNQSIEHCSPYPNEYDTTYIKGMVLLNFSPITLFLLVSLQDSTSSWPDILYSVQGLFPESTTLARASQLIQIQVRKKVAKRVLAFLIVFIVCFLPYHMFMLWLDFYSFSSDYYDAFWRAFHIVGFCLSYINSCINPIALFFVSKAFRNYFNQ